MPEDSNPPVNLDDVLARMTKSFPRQTVTVTQDIRMLKSGAVEQKEGGQPITFGSRLQEKVDLPPR